MAEAIVFSAYMYVQAGLIFAVFFLARGIHRVDSQTVGTGLGFRLIVLPGIVALWPILLKRWISRG